MPRLLRFVIGIAATFTAAACGNETSPVDSTEPRNSLTVRLSTELDTVPQATSHTLVARVTDAVGILQPASTVAWASVNPEIASVAGGVVTGVAVGTTRVIASASGAADTAMIVVTEDEVLVDIQPSAAAVIMGDTLQFTATARTRSGVPVPVNQFAWSSSDSLVASFTDAGIVITKNEGDVTVTAQALMHNGVSELKIVRSPVASVSITPSTADVYVGSTLQLQVTARDANGRVIRDADVSWGSSNYSNATVNQNGVVTGVATGTIVVTASSEGKTASATIYVLGAPAKKLELDIPADTVLLGATVQATAVPRDAEGNVLTGRVVAWQSSNPSVATVLGTGVVQGVAEGSSTISAISDGIVARKRIQVRNRLTTDEPVARVIVTPGSISTPVGGSVVFTATAYGADLTTVLQGRTTTWRSLNPSVAVVSSAGAVSAIGAGSAQIEASIEGKVSTGTITVTAAPPAAVAQVSVLLAAETLQSGQTTPATAVLKDAAGNVLTGRAITWFSVNPTVATVSSNGVVVAVGAGTVAIMARSEDVSGSASLTVAAPAPAPVASVTVSMPTTSLNVGQQVQAVVTLKDASGNVLTGRTITFSTDNAFAASVSASGVVTGVGAGTARIQVTSGGVSGSVNVTVTGTTSVAPTISSIVVGAAQTSLTAGQMTQANAVAKDNEGNTVPATFTWTTSNPSVATVSSTGLITSAGAGSATISASASGKTGSVSISVTAALVANVTVTLNPGTISAGATSQASTILKDATGNVLTGRTVVFSSSRTTVATVAATGVVTAVAAGTALIIASVDGVSSSASLTVAPPAPVANVSVALSPSTISVGQNASIGVTLRDASGAVLTGRVVTYASANPTIATVSPTGLVTGVLAGTTNINVSSEGVTNSAPITVQPATSVAVLPELPRSEPVVPSNLSSLACTVNVPAGGLQAAINAARGGAVLCLTGTHSGNFTVPARTDAGWVVIRSAGTIPAGRIRPSTAGSLAKIVTPNAAFALKFQTRSVRTLVFGVEISSTATVTTETVALVEVGTGNETAVSDLPTDIAFDRVYIHGWSNRPVRRAFALNGGAQTVVNSWCSEIHSGLDSQCVISWNGSGPFLIADNTLEAASENIMLGGADSRIPGVIASDVTIRRNHIAKPIAWKGLGWNVKTLIETKAGARVLIEQNVLDGSWLEGQTGYAMVLKSTNQNGSCRWCSSYDWTIRRNLIRNVGAGVTFGGRADGTQTDSSNRRMVFEENWVEPINVGQYTGDARPIMFTRDNSDIVIRKNVFEGGAAAVAVLFDGSGNPARNVTITNNVMPRGSYGLFTGGSSEGLPSWTNGPTGTKTWNGNALIGSLTVVYPAGTSWHSSLASALGAAGSITRTTLDALLTGVVIQP